MIVDDQVVIMGSANINDRSMLGTRDSELAIITRDRNLIETKMATKNYKAAKFAHQLRKELYMEHLGIKNQLEVADPLDPQLLKLMTDRANTNTRAYRDIFRCVPDELVKTA